MLILFPSLSRTFSHPQPSDLYILLRLHYLTINPPYSYFEESLWLQSFSGLDSCTSRFHKILGRQLRNKRPVYTSDRGSRSRSESTCVMIFTLALGLSGGWCGVGCRWSMVRIWLLRNRKFQTTSLTSIQKTMTESIRSSGDQARGSQRKLQNCTGALSFLSNRKSHSRKGNVISTLASSKNKQNKSWRNWTIVSSSLATNCWGCQRWMSFK